MLDSNKHQHTIFPESLFVAVHCEILLKHEISWYNNKRSNLIYSNYLISIFYVNAVECS